jgi:SAM-dependent methyltransferase
MAPSSCGAACGARPEAGEGSTRRMLGLLNRPIVWHVSRIGLDLAIGLYRKRTQKMFEWGLLRGHESVLDIGCGTGQYSALTSGEYLGIDLHEPYIRYARAHNRRPTAAFRCMDVRALVHAGASFDIVLLVDFLHHISDREALTLLQTAARLARGSVVNLEPIPDQTNVVGDWIVRHDRGQHVRPLARLRDLFALSGLRIVECQGLRLGPIDTVAILARPSVGSG